MRLNTPCSVSLVITGQATLKVPPKSHKDSDSDHLSYKAMCFEDVVRPERERPKREKGVMSNLDQLCEREHDCTNMLPTAGKTGSSYFVNDHYLYNC